MKYKILIVVYPKTGGCQFYRQIHAHELLERYPDFEISYKYDYTFVSSEEFKKYHLIQFHKNFVSPEILIKLKVWGVKTVVDFDDYWYLPYNHLSFLHYKKRNQPFRFIEIIKQADYLSVTTELLAKEVKKHNPNVFIFPNTLSHNCPQLYPIEIDNKDLRFGYLGGSCHLPDIELLRGLNNKLSNSGLKYSLNLFGYKHDSVYYDYAGVLTDNGRFTDNLTLYSSLPVPEYLHYYNMIDVSLVPLIPNKFNSLKSELKLFEASIFKKAVIASNVPPYKPFLRNKINCLVSEFRADWFKNIKYLIKNPDAAKDYGKQLNHDMQKHFNYEKITKYRAEIYKWIIQKG